MTDGKDPGKRLFDGWFRTAVKFRSKSRRRPAECGSHSRYSTRPFGPGRCFSAIRINSGRLRAPSLFLICEHVLAIVL